MISFLAIGCGQVGSAVSSLASSIRASSTQSAPTTPADDTTPPASPTPPPASPTVVPTTPTVTPPPTSPSVAPTTASPTAAPSTATTTPTPSPTPTPTTSSSVSPWLWVLIAIAAAALIGLIAWIVSARRRHATATTNWQTQLIDAYAKGSALHDAMAAAEVPGALSAPDAGARWSDIQRRADDFGQLLYMMRESARDDQERVRIAGVIASLQGVRSAMDAERTAYGPDPSMSGTVRDRLSAFGASLQALRDPRMAP